MTLDPDIEEKLKNIPHKNLKIYQSTQEGFECDFNAVMDGQYRGQNGDVESKSRIRIRESGQIDFFMIRLPPVENAKEKQDILMRIARRHFGKRAGCYGRSGNLHIKYPVNGTLFDYSLSRFLDDYNGFRSEIESKLDFN
jgi:hypothetical protein